MLLIQPERSYMSADEQPLIPVEPRSSAHAETRENLVRSDQENRKLRLRNTQLESALARASTTSQVIARQTEAENQRRNINDTVRESLITALQSENKTLMLRIDEDALELATKEERLRDLSTELILAHEKEQRRIARELHDELGQQLTALRLVISSGKTAPSETLKGLLVEAGEISDVLLETVRSICTTLRPQVLDDLGLIAGVSAHLQNFGARSGLEISFEPGSIDEQALSPIVQSVVFRVIQEAVTNVVRHAKAKGAHVTIGMEGPTLVFTIRDSGCGFEVEAVRNNPTTGLSSMIERLLLVNGLCEIVSRPNEGTSIIGRIPVITRPASPSSSQGN